MTLREAIRACLLAAEPVLEGASIFSHDDNEPGFFVDGKQVAHFAGPAAVELRLTRRGIAANRDGLRADPRVSLRRSRGDWVTVQVRTLDGLPFLAALLERVVATHLSPPASPRSRRQRAPASPAAAASTEAWSR